MLTKEQIQKEIEEMDSYVPVKSIEEKLGMPPTTLQKVLSGKRELPKKWHKVLQAYFVRDDISLKNLNNKTGDKEIKPPKTTDTTINTTSSRPFINDAIKKKLGIK